MASLWTKPYMANPVKQVQNSTFATKLMQITAKLPTRAFFSPRFFLVRKIQNILGPSTHRALSISEEIEARRTVQTALRYFQRRRRLGNFGSGHVSHPIKGAHTLRRPASHSAVGWEGSYHHKPIIICGRRRRRRVTASFTVRRSGIGSLIIE